MAFIACFAKFSTNSTGRSRIHRAKIDFERRHAHVDEVVSRQSREVDFNGDHGAEVGGVALPPESLKEALRVAITVTSC